MATDVKNQFRTVLVNNNFRVTKARELTFQLLLHPQPQSIGELLTKANGKIDRVSIYRNLELFEKLGIANRVYVGWKYKIELSDQFVAHHHHLSCIRCGRVIDIEDEKHIDEFIHDVAGKFGFSPSRHQFEIEGYCKNCTSKS